MTDARVYVLGTCPACSTVWKGAKILDLPVPRSQIVNITKLGETALGVTSSTGDLFTLGPDHCGVENQIGVGNSFKYVKQPAIKLASIGKQRALILRADGTLVRCEAGEVTEITQTSSGESVTEPHALLATKDGGIIVTSSGVYTLTINE